ncbi:SH3 domain-containing protein [Aliiroseovarius sp. PrR006]|uniref:SH3 domain-containing protein n=1 Tax=Aliiroseovarius sp. PrR006 TaxID=2706883 RepID=UPI0013D7D510|nr:SH3 domain-containing protein [Aliiroseovarius sp. PrR006]NDW54859.1 SH3 domain-containing protein [Aliiroseovarius sp. PrR006]
MGIIRMSLLTIGVLGVAMMHYGRDDGLPTDRIGREPDVTKDSIVAVSAKLAETPVSAVVPVVAAAPVEAPAPTSLVIKAAAEVGDPTSPAAQAEAAARLMAASAPAPTPTAPEAATGDAGFPTLFVSGSTVNMRGGPSTKFGVVSRLTRGTEVLETGQTDNGWSQIKVVETGTRGFIASKFLKPQL